MARTIFTKVRRTAHDAGNGMSLTRRDVGEVYDSMRDANRMLASRDAGRSALARTLEPSADTVTGRAVASTEVLAAAVAMGVLAARTGSANIPGTSIPAGPVIWLAGQAIAAFDRDIGLPEWVGPHAATFGTGALAAWGTLWGMGLGAGMREKAGLAPTDVRVGGLPGGSGAAIGCGPSGMCDVRPIGEAEMAALYRAA